MKYDIVIVTVPFVRRIPQTGPALLKASVEKAGFSCKVLDWNFDIWNNIQNIKTTTIKLNDKNIAEYTISDMKNFCLANMEKISKPWIKEIKNLKATWIGLSTYSSRTSRIFLNSMLPILRRNLPNIKIIVGGHGFSLPNTNWGAVLLKKGLIDFFVKGEGEETLVSLLKGEKNIAGINGIEMNQIEDLDKIPFANYSDTPPNKYPLKKSYIVTSRGCVRRCNFCYNYFKKIRFRSPENVVDELIDLYNKYGIVDFFFADSLSNGNPKQLKGICNTIIKAMETNRLPKISWGSSMSVLSRGSLDKKVYKLMSNSGCTSINIGVESGSDKVRKDMNKATKDEDIYFMIEQCRKNRINLDINFIVGYYTETEEDFEKTLNLITNISYCLKDIHVGINVGPTFQVLNISDWKIAKLNKDRFGQWYYKDNTFPVRMDRWKRLVTHCQNLNFKTLENQKKLLMEKLEKYGTSK
jgi:radical SAM superfamily enzyme YgiQ (UPF0313 family)